MLLFLYFPIEVEDLALGDYKYQPIQNLRITQYFSPSHKGVDIISSSRNRTIYNIEDCYVYEINLKSFNPYLICFSGEIYYKYMHFTNSKGLHQGQFIRYGQELGKYNNLGKATGYHLHLEVFDEKWISLNPVKNFKNLDKK